MAYTVKEFIVAFPDAQFVGGDVILHVGSKNVVAAKLVAEDTVVLTEAGKNLVESVDTSAGEEKPKRRRGKTDDLDLEDL